MNIEEIKQKYCMDKAPYKAPYYLINGKRADHMDLIKFAKEHKLPTDGRNGSIIDWAKKIAGGKSGNIGNGKAYSPEAIANAKAFLAAVKGPFKD